jgi:hypothetical protein
MYDHSSFHFFFPFNTWSFKYQTWLLSPLLKAINMYQIDFNKLNMFVKIWGMNMKTQWLHTS